MEGMISKEISVLQYEHTRISGSVFLMNKWSRGLVVKLLETTHGQWLYCNVQVYDSMMGVNATLRKEELQLLIEDQLELGEEGLEEEDKYLLEINLDDLTTTSGKTQTYWLLAIRAARDARILRENVTNTNAAGHTA